MVRPRLNDSLFRRMCRARDRVRTGFKKPITLQELAREASLSTWHFQRLFTATFGTSALGYLTELRIAHAKKLLASGAYSVTETCLESGYSSVSSFSARFRKLVGYSPLAYQREIRKVFGPTAASRHEHLPTCFLIHYAGHE
jgi:AraC-like DNA-binding protein